MCSGTIYDGSSCNNSILKFQHTLTSIYYKPDLSYFLSTFQGSDSRGVTLIQRWTESQPRQDFHLPIMMNDSYTFSWAFQKLGQGNSKFKFEDDVAKIFSINVTNTIDGGAAMCLPCHQVSTRVEYCGRRMQPRYKFLVHLMRDVQQ